MPFVSYVRTRSNFERSSEKTKGGLSAKKIGTPKTRRLRKEKKNSFVFVSEQQRARAARPPAVKT
jgi:hypothetical protein